MTTRSQPTSPVNGSRLISSASHSAPSTPNVISSPAPHFNTVSALHALSTLATRPYHISSKTRRACVVMLLRIAPAGGSPLRAVDTLSTPPPSTAVVTASNATDSAVFENLAAAADKDNDRTDATTNPAPSTAAPAPTVTHTSPIRSAVPAPHIPESPPTFRLHTPAQHALSDADHIRTRILELCTQQWVQNGTLELLYMQRSTNPKDRWSGQIAFPGGRQTAGEQDVQTAEREVAEEIGIHLNDSTQYIRLGRLDDHHMDGFKNVKPLAICVFVYLQVTPVTPIFRLAPSETASVQFVPLSFFAAARSRTEFDFVVHPLVKTFVEKNRARRIRRVQQRQERETGSTHRPSSSNVIHSSATDQPTPLPSSSPTPSSSDSSPSAIATASLSSEDIESVDSLNTRPDRVHSWSSIKHDSHSTSSHTATSATVPVSNLATLPHPASHPTSTPPLPVPNPLGDVSKHATTALAGPIAGAPNTLGTQLKVDSPTLEQLAALQFPALRLPGPNVNASGESGISDGVQTVYTRKDGSTYTVPAFLLWGFTLVTTSEFVQLLGFDGMYRYIARGAKHRRQLVGALMRYETVKQKIEKKWDTAHTTRDVTQTSGTTAQPNPSHPTPSAPSSLSSAQSVTSVPAPVLSGPAELAARVRRSVATWRERLLLQYRLRALPTTPLRAQPTAGTVTAAFTADRAPERPIALSAL